MLLRRREHWCCSKLFLQLELLEKRFAQLHDLNQQYFNYNSQWILLEMDMSCPLNLKFPLYSDPY